MSFVWKLQIVRGQNLLGAGKSSVNWRQKKLALYYRRLTKANLLARLTHSVCGFALTKVREGIQGNNSNVQFRQYYAYNVRNPHFLQLKLQELCRFKLFGIP